MRQVISISDITLKSDFQFRTFTDKTHIMDLVSVWQADGKFADVPVVTCQFSDGKPVYRIQDGTHRILAASEAGATDIEVDVVMVESAEDAMFAAMSANTRHGKPLTIADVELILTAIKNSSRVSEFTKANNKWAWDKQKLRDFLKCSMRLLERALPATASEFTTARDYSIMQLRGEGLSLSRIAEELEVPRTTVNDVCKSYESITTDTMANTDGIDNQVKTDSDTDGIDNSARSVNTNVEVTNCPFDDFRLLEDGEDDDEDDDEIFMSMTTAIIVNSLSRGDEVINNKLTPTVDLECWVAQYKSMPKEQQVEALKLLGIKF